MEQSIGRRIYELRRNKGMTQEQLAEVMNVSAQAVSKWENDVSCPDVAALPALARELGVTVDELLGGNTQPTVQLVPEKDRDVSKLILRISVDSVDGDRVRVNLPLAIVKAALDIGLAVPQLVNAVGEDGKNALANVDWMQLFAMAEKGVIGKLVEVESKDGDSVSVTVE